MAEKMGGELPSDDPREQEVSKIGQYLVAHTEAENSPWKFRFHVLNDEETVNAFALPGGQVFITLGLLNRLQTEAELAGVLGHEMGHVIQRHSAQQMAKSQLGDMLVVAVGIGAGSGQNQGGGGINPVMVAATVNHMFQLRYSRHDESEADAWGVRLMEEAGYDPKAMIQVLQILKEVGGSSGHMEIFQTHPNPDLRIAQLEAILKEHPPKPGLSEGKRLKNGVPVSY
jgi:predicted Zn-dependent protease